MALLSPFQIPDELLISSLCNDFPCRESQIRSLVSLLLPYSKTPKNIVIYGLEATGKSTITVSTLSTLCSSYIYPDFEINGVDERRGSLYYTVVKSAECITGRHLLETIIGSIAHAVGWKKDIHACENVAQLAVEISCLLDNDSHKLESNGGNLHSKDKFVLVLDGIDKQRDSPATLLPALARMGEVIPGLTIIFIVTSPRPHFLHVPGVPHIHFPAYAKHEALQILSLHTPPTQARSRLQDDPEEDLKHQKDMKDIWTRFCSAVWDTLSKHSGRDVLSFRSTCTRLWPTFIAPLHDGLFTTKDFSRLLVSRRSLFQDERVLTPSITTTTTTSTIYSSTTAHNHHPLHPSSSSITTHDPPPPTGLATHLPTTSRLLLIAAYLASYTSSRHDTLLFTTASQRTRRQNRGGGSRKPRNRASKHRKIPAALLGPQGFVLERMFAIFAFLRCDVATPGAGTGAISASAGTADVPMAVATLASLRLLVRTSTSTAGDALDASAKWRVNFGWEVVRGVARSVGVEVEDFIIE